MCVQPDQRLHDTADEMFHNPMGFISHVQLGKSPEKVIGKRRTLQKKKKKLEETLLPDFFMTSNISCKQLEASHWVKREHLTHVVLKGPVCKIH